MDTFQLLSAAFLNLGLSQNEVLGNGLIATFQLSSADFLNLGWSQNKVLGNGLIATFQLSSAASLNFGRSQNVVLENGLNYWKMCTSWTTLICNFLNPLLIAFVNKKSTVPLIFFLSLIW